MMHLNCHEIVYYKRKWLITVPAFIYDVAVVVSRYDSVDFEMTRRFIRPLEKEWKLC